MRAWRIAFLVLATIGACLAGDLLRLHVNVHTDPDYHSYCAMSERVNCETVAASSWAVFAGLPVALWGLVTYLAMFGLAVWGLRPAELRSGWPFGILFWISALAALLGVGLFVVSHFVIQSVCIVCLGTYLVNVGLAVTAGLALRRAGLAPGRALAGGLERIRQNPVAPAIYAAIIAATIGTSFAMIPRYWHVEVATGPGGLAVGSTSEGHFWIGARDPRLVIEEYSDYQCPHCLRGHGEVRALVGSHPEEIRLVHRSYPLDQLCNPSLRRPMHESACRYAWLAYCAGQQGRFWEANDYLFANGRRGEPVGAPELAETLGLDAREIESCVASDATRRAVEADLADGARHGVQGTPTFVIGVRSYPGKVPEDVIREALGQDSP